MREEGRKIARDYLSKLGWTREWRRTVFREVYPAAYREDEESKFRTADQMEENAEAELSAAFERLRKDSSPSAKEVLAGVYEILGKRNDLGFFGKRIVARIKQML